MSSASARGRALFRQTCQLQLLKIINATLADQDFYQQILFAIADGGKIKFLPLCILLLSASKEEFSFAKP